MAFTTLPASYAAALINHLANTATLGSSPPVTPPGQSDAATGGPGAPVPSGAAATGAGLNFDPSSIKYGSTGGTAWQMANAGPWNFFTGGPYAPNAGQKDEFGNVYNSVNNALWTGGYVDPTTLPPKSTGVNSQLWGGPESDSPPAWLQKIVQDALSLSGDAKTARIQHIMSGLIDPSHGANQHDLGYAERMFGITGGQ